MNQLPNLAALKRLAPAKVIQASWVVPDLGQAMALWSGVLGVGPFFQFLDVKVDDLRYRGAAADFRFDVAIAQSGDIQIELVQQRCDSPSAYRDLYAPGTGGFHHLGYFTEDFDGEVERLRGGGFVPAVEGRVGAMRFAYVDTSPAVGCMLEVLEEDSAMRDTFRRIRAAAEGWSGDRPVRAVEELADSD